MTTPSRFVPVLMVLALASACGGGDSDNPSAGAGAATHACRSYVLGGGADGQPIAKELSSAIAGGDGYEATPMVARVRAVQTAAAQAGLTEKLPVKDFRLYRAVVQSALNLEAQLLPSSDNVSLDEGAIATFRDAASAAEDRCD